MHQSAQTLPSGSQHHPQECVQLLQTLPGWTDGNANSLPWSSNPTGCPTLMDSLPIQSPGPAVWTLVNCWKKCSSSWAEAGFSSFMVCVISSVVYPRKLDMVSWQENQFGNRVKSDSLARESQASLTKLERSNYRLVHETECIPSMGTYKTQASQGTHQVPQTFSGIFSLDYLPWSIAFFLPALTWCAGGTLGEAPWILDLNLSPGCLFSVCMTMVSSFCSLNLDILHGSSLKWIIIPTSFMGSFI